MPPPGPPGTQMPRGERIPPVITLIGAMKYGTDSGHFRRFFDFFSGRRDLLFWLGDGLFGLATAGGGRYVESLEPQVSTQTDRQTNKQTDRQTHTHTPPKIAILRCGRTLLGCMSLLTSILAITALRINVQYIRLRASVHTSGQGSKESVHKCQL